ncbi:MULTISPECIES: F0F1 ATP synthase subunit gamma [unclassified Guyparkeria]|uniref:F0F1 ATP synthase subunit gamma n=1 Tax=unclassified Guyparkeria TaxID=2626246 RepID=UPI0007339BD6|nr:MULTISPECIES: F0F1 ATP synthase subunit gamma [unclassified Guyparkeria]KTG16657.1 ATP F0F1 synthase subunit gamma [Guyparkeria sp. XI15]OAE85691.1 ATP F0F1 synthase subunit gamma [Guyparkeria sp. WRN-7]
MAVGKEIRTKIKSVQNTRKITKAMEMVAASKMRRAQEAMEATRPYAEKFLEVVGHITNAHPEYRHPLMVEREVKRVLMIVVTTDRGLCGGLNVNLLKRVGETIREYEKNGVEVDVIPVGSKGRAFFRRYGGNVLTSVTGLGDKPSYAAMRKAINAALAAFENGDVDRIELARNEFVNSMTQNPTVEQIAPLQYQEDESLKHHWDYIYEPDSEIVLDAVLKRYISGLIVSAAVENVACEMSARRIAMKNASDNASDMITDLKLQYNKARQAAITQEISEIVSGAAAV